MKADISQATCLEVLALTNGCGPSLRWLKWTLCFVPAGLFEWAGRRHDWDYVVGGTWHDRRRADVRFLANCLLEAADASVWRILPYFCLALLYFVAVKIGGPTCFSYRAVPRTHEEMRALAEKGK
jgi:hypothetical protein